METKQAEMVGCDGVDFTDCPDCNRGLKTCPECRGSGVYWVYDERRPCKECRGEGELWCKGCKGRGSFIRPKCPKEVG